MPEVRRTKALELLWAAHRWVYRWTGGRVGSKVNGMPLLLLTTTGRRTARTRTSLLEFLSDGDHYIVVASNAGEPQDPGWFLNLQTNSAADIQVGTVRMRVSARMATAQERDRHWREVIEADSGYAEYQSRTTRQIRVVVLEPVRRQIRRRITRPGEPPP